MLLCLVNYEKIYADYIKLACWRSCITYNYIGKCRKEGDNLIIKIATKIYAGRVRNQEVLLKSSSGGAFVALSDCFLNHTNMIVASSYNYQTHAENFTFLHNKTERNNACGSKYMQSKLGNVFKDAEQWVNDNPEKSLLFVGMGCQADGFRKYAELKGFRDRVYIVDIVCHGSPSPKLWREYAESIERKHGGKISYVTFKDKRNGWNSPTAVVVINNREISIKDYVRIFYNRCALRPSCHVCPYATVDRKTDITIGDFWHIEQTIPDFYDPNGTSLFLIHTNRGEELFEKIKGNLDYRLSNTQQCWQANLEAPTPVSKHRQEFWNDYKEKGIDYIMKKYGTVTLTSKVKNKLFKIIRGGGNTR